MTDLLTHPFVLGLMLGLLLAFALGLSGWSQRRALKLELRQLQTQQALAQADSGLVAWVRKTIRPALGNGAPARSLPPGAR